MQLYLRGGLTVVDVADRFSVGRDLVMEELRRAGVPARRAWDAETLAKAKELYANGLSLKAVGSRLGVNKGTVASRLREAGVQLRPSTRSQPNH